VFFCGEFEIDSLSIIDVILYKIQNYGSNKRRNAFYYQKFLALQIVFSAEIFCLWSLKDSMFYSTFFWKMDLHW
jgi:hypothetical protein